MVRWETERRLDKFFSDLEHASHRILLLDYDGTLAPFREERNQAEPYPGIRYRLKQLLDLKSTRVVIISGRWSKHLIPLLGLAEIPEIWGSHGAERVMPDRSIQLVELNEEVIKGLTEADHWGESEGLADTMERKPAGLAFHWRGLDTSRAERIRQRIEEHWINRVARHRLELHEFDGGVELRAADVSKGQAVQKILEEAPDDAMVAYLGDDLTDEDAFKALDGRGLRVLVRKDYRDTDADVWIRPPEELLDFLDHWIIATA